MNTRWAWHEHKHRWTSNILRYMIQIPKQLMGIILRQSLLNHSSESVIPGWNLGSVPIFINMCIVKALYYIKLKKIIGMGCMNCSRQRLIITIIIILTWQTCMCMSLFILCLWIESNCVQSRQVQSTFFSRSPLSSLMEGYKTRRLS